MGAISHCNPSPQDWVGTSQHLLPPLMLTLMLIFLVPILLLLPLSAAALRC